MILDDAESKIDRFNKRGIHYEAVYHYIMRRRRETVDIYHDDFLDDIAAALVCFDMQRMMGSQKYMADVAHAWANRLERALQPHSSSLDHCRSLRLQDADVRDRGFAESVRLLFDDLERRGPEGLNRRNEGEDFYVGASKILHFLVPDLFIILDSNARRELSRYHSFSKSRKDGLSYLTAMACYQRELTEWSGSHDDPDFQKLVALDSSWRRFGGVRETPLRRILDKCAFAGSKAK
jgi:hypothetical protein